MVALRYLKYQHDLSDWMESVQSCGLAMLEGGLEAAFNKPKAWYQRQNASSGDALGS